MTVLLLPNSAFGEMEMGYLFTPDEMVLVPRWCQVKLLTVRRENNLPGGENVPDSVLQEYAKWNVIIGKDIYVYTHHYCRALNWINRYKRSFTLPYKNVEKDRERALQNALSQFKFMRGRLQPKHKLYYEMLMEEAYVLWEMKNFKGALRNYDEILKRKPDFAPVYVKYAELLISVGETEVAVKLLKSGLEKTGGDQQIVNKLSSLESVNED